jgi:hypothetical protein
MEPGLPGKRGGNSQWEVRVLLPQRGKAHWQAKARDLWYAGFRKTGGSSPLPSQGSCAILESALSETVAYLRGKMLKARGKMTSVWKTWPLRNG